MPTPVRFYLDENVPVQVATQLQRRGVDAVTVRDLGLLGVADESHLARATRLGRVLCTHDTDYVQLAMSGRSHAGIILGQQQRHGIGDWVRYFELTAAILDADEMVNRIAYVG